MVQDHFFEDMANIYYGTELKLSISIDPIQGLKMADYDFVVELFTTTAKIVSQPKAQLIKIDDDTFVARADTKLLGKGRVTCKITAFIPDGDFKDGKRNEVCIVDTGINIVG